MEPASTELIDASRAMGSTTRLMNMSTHVTRNAQTRPPQTWDRSSARLAKLIVTSVAQRQRAASNAFDHFYWKQVRA